MKFHIDINTRRFVRSAAAAIPLETLFFKRRDAFEVEVVFVDRTGIVPTPAGTTFLAGIKSSFGGDFLALTDAAGVLNLHTSEVEALFADEPEKVSAYFEIKSTTPGEQTRTHTLAIDLQNAVILGDEGVPADSPSLKASQAEAQAGLSNDKWMTPLRTAEAIAALATSGGTAVTWSTLAGKPTTFPPSTHTHAIADTTGLADALAAKQPLGNYAAATHQHSAADITSGTIDPARLPVLPSSIQVVSSGTIPNLTQAEQDQIVAGAVVTTSDGGRYIYRAGAKTNTDSYVKLADLTPDWSVIANKPTAFTPATHQHTISDTTGLEAALDGKQAAGSYATAAQGALADSASQPGHTHTTANVTGLDTALAAKISGTGVASIEVVQNLPATLVPTTFYILIPSGATAATSVQLGSIPLFTGSGGGGDNGGGGGGSWAPTDIANLALWLDATSGLYDSASGGGAVTTNGAYIARWEDRSGNARHFTQATINNRPTLATSALNSKNTITFDGTDDFLDATYSRPYAAQTLFIVGKITTGKTQLGIFAESQAAVTDQSIYLPAVAGTTTIGSTTDGSATRKSASTFSPGDYFIATFTHSGTTLANYLNGTAAVAEADTFPGGTYNVTRARLGGRINANGTNISGANLPGSIGEVIAYDRLLTTAERDTVHSYLSTKWGIAL